MSSCILRVEKLHQKGEFSASAAHLTRERECKNADPEKLHLNKNLYGAKKVAHAVQLRDERLALSDRKVRNDAVTCLEYVITASPEWYKDRSQKEIDQYHKSSLEWIKAKHGAENVIQAVVHMDEKSPHMHVMVIPLVNQVTKKGKEVYTLNAKAFTGNSILLSQMQDDFHDSVAKQMGLERGQKGSTRHHQRVKSFYGSLELERLAPAVEIPKKKLFERQSDYEQRVKPIINEQQAGWAVAEKQHADIRAKKKLSAEYDKLNVEKSKVIQDKELLRSEAQKINEHDERNKKFSELLLMQEVKRKQEAEKELPLQQENNLLKKELDKLKNELEYYKNELQETKNLMDYQLYNTPIETIIKIREDKKPVQKQVIAPTINRDHGR